jgi:hypothetical protein
MRDGNAPFDQSERKDALRKNKQRARMRDAGFVQMTTWVHAEDMAKVKKQIARLKARRMDDEES